jgi:hypothetical protein
MMTRSGREPRHGPSWFRPEPFYALDVVDLAPDATVVIDDTALGLNGPLSAIDPGQYTVQAVMRRNPDSPKIGVGPGTVYSRPVTVHLDPAAPRNIALTLDQVVAAPVFRETDRIQLVEVRSELLSAFHGREIIMRAAVILPKGYDTEDDRRYPAHYWIHGFGGDHFSAPMLQRRWDIGPGSNSIVRIIPDPSCFGGHHVFADSANNGPRGRAFIEELIPHIERRFPVVPDPSARFLGGHSSGGWASLWLQVANPDFFGGVWSVAPDPVDFRDFQRIDLYAEDANMYRDADGGRRPLARQGETVMVYYEDFARMEVVHGEGGQLRSFEWVFSPRGDDGLPMPLYDRETGAVDPDVAASWRRYDIRHQLESNWNTLAPKLRGKLHVFMGELDTFYLDGATRLLEQSLARLGSDAVIEIVPGADHSSVSTRRLSQRIDEEMLAAFRAGGMN